MVMQMERRVWERGRGFGRRGKSFERKAESVCPHWHVLTSPVQVLRGRQEVCPADRGRSHDHMHGMPAHTYIPPQGE